MPTTITRAAYALANGKIADYSSAMQESIAAIRTNVSENADVAKEQLAAVVYRTAIAASTASIIISAAALLQPDLRIPAGNYPSVKDTEGDSQILLRTLTSARAI